MNTNDVLWNRTMESRNCFGRAALWVGMTALLLVLGGCPNPTDGGTSPDITYTATANGTSDTENSTAIALVFSADVAGLLASDITVADGTGSATKGALSGSEKSWSLAIAVATAGTVTVSINKDGIESAGKSVTVHKDKAALSDITYTVAANGTSGTETSTALALVFSADVAGLLASDITVADGTGSVTKGALSGGEKSWSLAITVATAGSVTVSINKDGIESAEKSVTVHKATLSDITYAVAANGTSDTETSTALALVFSADVAGLLASDITVADGTGSVTKGALSGGEKSWSLAITVATAGTVTVSINKDGIESAGKSVTVHKATHEVTVTIKDVDGTITVTGIPDGGISLSKSGDPATVTLTVEGFTSPAWYVDGSGTKTSAESITLTASEYGKGAHSVSFTGFKDGLLFSNEIPFTVAD
jgi:hypothetical protein